MVKPSLSEPAAITVEREFVSSSELTASRVVTILDVTLPQSPPPGAFNLRI
jgi:hypothetical protein